MRAWRPEAAVRGPERAGERDIDALNRVFTDAFTDRYRRDGLAGVRVPPLNPAVWRYALLNAGDGAMVWRDERGGVAAFNVAHRSGAEGWMGPLCVRPDRQGQGLGKSVVRAAVDYLVAGEVRTLGLETMPRTVENIGFYSRLGFAPGYLTVTLTHDLPRRPGAPAPALLSERRGENAAAAVAAARDLAERLGGGADYTRELLLTAELDLGDTTLVDGAHGLAGFALWHSAPLSDTRARDEVRVLKLAAQDEAAFDAVITAVEASAARAAIPRVSLRCQTACEWGFRRLVARGYRVRWTDLRMTYEGYPAPAPGSGVVWSNWEM